MAETKYVIDYCTGSFSSIASSWLYYKPAITLGTGSFANRIGRKVSISGFEIVGTIVGGQSNLATDDKRNTLRIVVGTTSGAQAAPLGTPLAGIAFSDPIIRIGAAATARLHLYKDRFFNMLSSSPDSTGYMPAMRKVFFKHNFKRPLVINYADDTANNPDRNYFIAMISDSFLAPHPGFTTGFIKTYYKDI